LKRVTIENPKNVANIGQDCRFNVPKTEKINSVKKYRVLCVRIFVLTKIQSNKKIKGPSVITRKTCPPKCGLSHGAMPTIIPKKPSRATSEFVNFHHK
jgi:hypothetical protein